MMEDEIRSLLPKPEYTRREFVVTTLAAGFALAVQPIACTTVSTAAAGLTAGEVSIPVPGGTIPAYRAMPKEGTKLPVVLVVHEIFGVHEHIRDLCRRLAKSGYMAIAPDLFAREGDVAAMSDIQEIMAKVVSRVPDDQVLSDLDATAAWAGSTGSADPAALAITGFCWGGRLVWLYAAHNAKLRAGAAWYGRLEGPTSPLQPQHPIDVARELKAPVIGFYGGKDQGIPLESVERMRGALRDARSPSEIIVYPNAGHAFNADYRASYRPEEAAEAWRTMLAWFDERLRG